MPFLLSRLERLSGEPERAVGPQQHLRIMSAFWWAVVLTLMVLTAVEWWAGPKWLAQILTVATVACLLVQIPLRRFRSPLVAGHCLIAIIFISCTVIDIISGSQSNSSMVLPLVVVYAALLLSSRAGIIWALLCLASIIGVYLLFRGEMEPLVTVSAGWQHAAQIRTATALCIFALLVGVGYRRALAYMQRGLETALQRERQAHQAQRSEHKRFADFAEVAADGFWETDSQHQFTFVSRGFVDTIGLPEDEILGRTPAQAYATHMPGNPLVEQYMARLESRQPFTEERLDWNQPDRKGLITLLNSGRPCTDDNDDFLGFRGAVRDVTRDIQLQERLEYYASYDSLTDLLNRRVFEAELAQLCESDAADSYWLIAIDLDRFIQVNDTGGHAAGDALLKSVARIIDEQCTGHCFSGRVGGDEFSLVTKQPDADAASRVASAIVEEIGSFRLPWRGRTYSVGASSGIAALVPGDADETMRRADEACYEVKRGAAGASQVRRFGTDGAAQE